MVFLFCPFRFVLPVAKTVSHQSHMAKLGFSLLLTELESNPGRVVPMPFSKIHVRTGVLMTTLETKQFFRNAKQLWPLAVLWLLPPGMGRTSVNWVIQSLRSFFNEWENPEVGCQWPLACAQFPSVKGTEQWQAISESPLLPPQNLRSACPSCEVGLWHFAAAGLWMFRIVCLYFQGYSLKMREQTDSKEFRSQDATASSFGGLILCLYIPYLIPM